MLISSLLPNCSAHNDFYTSIGELSLLNYLISIYLGYQALMFFYLCFCIFVYSIMSTGQMTDLLFMEKDLVTSLKDYIKAEESKLEQVKQ